jgi:YD repeat-containing protein
MEAGERWTLADVAGRVRYAWDSRDHCRHTAYDQLGRPTDVHLQRGADIETLVGRVEYGESQPDAAAHNLRGKPYRSFDEAGVVTTRDYDFKGNALVTSRQLTVVYASQPDWSTNVGLETEVFTTRRTFDARNRVTTVTTPDSSVGRHAYNEAGLLEAIDVNIRGDAAQSEPVWTPFVLDIDYDAKGQRTRVAYGNGVVTTFEYDPQTFRLIRLRTFHGDDVLQDLAYTYDPVGNITHIEDSVQPDVFFRNQRVAASQDFRYDAIRQLVEATGREHLGQLNGQAGAPVAPDPFNVFHVGQEHPGDGLAVGRYIERYAYDAVGNFLEMQHVGSDPAHPGWTRTYGYQEPSQLGGDTVSNRLSWTEVGGGPVDRYTYDAHGNMATMPHLPVMQWNDRDQLTASSRQVADEGTAETTWYVYDSSGQRVRKVTNRAAAAGEPTRRLRERIYLGGIELYREYVGDAISLERETLHVSDGAQRVALVETRTSGATDLPSD